MMLFRQFALTACGSLAFAACADLPSTAPTQPAVVAQLGVASVAMTPARISSSTPPSAAERRNAEVLGRALSLALSDPSVRQEVKAAIAGSQAREHKLELASFLEGRGGRILAAAVKAGGPDIAAVQHAVAGLRQLEFYMPVDAHRTAWAGDGNLIVAVALDDAAPIGFTLDGRQVALDLTHPPATPTLVATRIETNLTEQAALNRKGMGYACATSTVEPLNSAAKRCGRVGMAPNVSASRMAPPTAQADLSTDPNAVGLYMTFLRILDAHEYWYQGQPEVEVHVTGRRAGSSGIVDYQCAGEHAADPLGLQPGVRSQSYVFDMNGNFWNGSVLLLNPAQVDSLQRQLPDGFNVSVWEDDEQNGACVIRPKPGISFADLVTATHAVSNGIDAIRVDSGPNYGVLAASLHALYDVFTHEGDEYNGLMVDKDSTSFAGQNPGTTHMIYTGTTLNGRAILVFKSTRYAPPPSGSVASIEVTPTVDTVGVGNIRQFSALAYDASGRSVPNASIVWQSSAPSIAKVDVAGTVQGMAGGSATITASSNGVAAAAPVRVTSPVLSARISGPSRVGPPGGLCTYFVSPNGGTGALTYEWKVNGTYYSSNTSIDVNVQSAVGLTATVRDANNAEAVVSLDVRYASGSPTCMQ